MYEWSFLVLARRTLFAFFFFLLFFKDGLDDGFLPFFFGGVGLHLLNLRLALVFQIGWLCHGAFVNVGHDDAPGGAYLSAYTAVDACHEVLRP